MVNDEDVAKQMTFEKLCASGDCSSMPAKQKMQIKVCSTLHNNYFYPIFKICQYLLQLHYDDTFNADTSDVTGYLDGMVTHLQSHFCHISLGTQIQVEVFTS